MLTTHIRSEYKRFRKLGNNANQAIRAAKILEEFEAIGDENIRLRIVPDYSPDLSFLDQEIFADTREETYARANRDGIWGIIGEYKCPTCGEWKHTDSCYGFIGDDWKDSGYDIDIMISTVRQYQEAIGF